MAYDLSVINYRTIRDPVEFILESDETYDAIRSSLFSRAMRHTKKTLRKRPKR